MSTVIIGGGGSGGHNAITRLVIVYSNATAQQKADILTLLDEFTQKANALADAVDANK